MRPRRPALETEKPIPGRVVGQNCLVGRPPGVARTCVAAPAHGRCRANRPACSSRKQQLRLRLRGCTSRVWLASHGLATYSPVKMVQVLVFVNMV
jgi:hypothetical protein